MVVREGEGVARALNCPPCSSSPASAPANTKPFLDDPIEPGEFGPEKD